MTTTIDEDENMMNMDELSNKHLLREELNDDSKTHNFSDLADEKLTELFGEALRFELCNIFLNYDHILQHHKLFGTIRVAETPNGFSPDPLNPFSDIFNRGFNNPEDVSMFGWQYLYDIHYCSLPVSSTSTLHFAAKLYVTTEEVDDVEIYPEPQEDHQSKALNQDEVDHADEELKQMCMLSDYSDDNYDNNKTSKKLDCNACEEEVKCFDEHEAFQVCDGHAFINFSDKPNGGWGRRNILKGRDGSLELYYVALKYAVDAHLEVKLVSSSKVSGRIVAYYGKEFDYETFPLDYFVVLSKTTNPDVDFIEPGNINLMRSVLAVPAQFSLIIEAELYDTTSRGRVDLLSGTCEFPVPLDGRSSTGSIDGEAHSLELRVNWKLPFEKAKFYSSPICFPSPFSSNSSVGRLTERRKSGTHTTSSMANSGDDDNRWSLEEEIEKVFNTSLERTFNLQEAGSCSISSCTKEDDGDYLCTSVLHIWPQLRDTYEGPKRAGRAVKDNIMASEYKDMMERCVVCGPGFVKFKLSRKWIAKSIQKMLAHGIDTWAPKLSVKKAIIYFMSRVMTKELHMGHLRLSFIGEALARMLDYSGVVVLSKGIHVGDHLEIKVHAVGLAI